MTQFNPFFYNYTQINNLRKTGRKSRRILIYKENLLFHRQFWAKWAEFLGFQKTAPKTAEIPLALQGLIKVQLYCPDFDNGMKTERGEGLRRHPRCCTARTLITG